MLGFLLLAATLDASAAAEKFPIDQANDPFASYVSGCTFQRVVGPLTEKKIVRQWRSARQKAKGAKAVIAPSYASIMSTGLRAGRIITKSPDMVARFSRQTLAAT